VTCSTQLQQRTCTIGGDNQTQTEMSQRDRYNGIQVQQTQPLVLLWNTTILSNSDLLTRCHISNGDLSCDHIYFHCSALLAWFTWLYHPSTHRYSIDPGWLDLSTGHILHCGWCLQYGISCDPRMATMLISCDPLLLLTSCKHSHYCYKLHGNVKIIPKVMNNFILNNLGEVRTTRNSSVGISA